MSIHSSVMVDEVLEYLSPARPNQLLVDATIGEGGHSVLFLERFPRMRVVGVDADERILAVARDRVAAYRRRVTLYNNWFDHFFESYPHRRRPDRILMDLGVSMYHFRHHERGFSFRDDGPLDMRLGATTVESAADLVNRLPEEELASLIYRYGEERYSRRIARAIVVARDRSPIETTAALAGVIESAVPAAYRRGRIHPATRTFQALRIAVNDELGRIERGVSSAIERLAIGGRIGVIAFHSLEDRIVKWVFRARAGASIPEEYAPMIGSGSSTIEILTKKPIRPTERETDSNPAARTARLRVAEKSEA